MFVLTISLATSLVLAPPPVSGNSPARGGGDEELVEEGPVAPDASADAAQARMRSWENQDGRNRAAFGSALGVLSLGGVLLVASIVLIIPRTDGDVSVSYFSPLMWGAGGALTIGGAIATHYTRRKVRWHREQRPSLSDRAFGVGAGGMGFRF